MKNNQSVGRISHLITLDEAAAMNGRYRAEKDAILAKGVSLNILPICETFSRADFDTLFAQPGCIGVRIYLGMKDNLDISAVVVGVNGNNEDMINPESLNNVIIENGFRCPADCPPKSELN